MATASFVTDITEIITQAAEAAAMIGSLWSSFGVVNQARQYYNLYNTQRQFYYTTFQQGAELPLAIEVYNTNIAVRNYTAAANEPYLTTGVFSGAMGDTVGWWTRHNAMFGDSPATSILSDEYAQDRMLMLGHWSNVMFRFEESNVDLLNDQRWDHRMKLHNAALKEQSAVVSALASAEGQREETLTKTASYYAEVSNSLAERRGLVRAHKDVQARYAELSAGSMSQAAYVPGQSNRGSNGGSSSYRASPSAWHMEPSDNDHFRDVN